MDAPTLPKRKNATPAQAKPRYPDLHDHVRALEKTRVGRNKRSALRHLAVDLPQPLDCGSASKRRNKAIAPYKLRVASFAAEQG